MLAAILQSIAQHAVFYTVQFGIGEVVVSYSGHCTSHPVEYCTYAYQTHFPWWLVYCVVGGGELNLCWACVPPTVTVLGCCYSCMMQSLAKQIQTDPKIVYQSGLTPAKVSLHIRTLAYLLHAHVSHTYDVHVCNAHAHTHARTHAHTHTDTHTHTHTHTQSYNYTTQHSAHHA